MECFFAYNIMKMMVPHDCHALLKERTIVTEATSLGITVHPCCNHEQVRTNLKDNDKSNVLFMWRNKKMKANECQYFSFGCFLFLFL